MVLLKWRFHTESTFTALWERIGMLNFFLKRVDIYFGHSKVAKNMTDLLYFSPLFSLANFLIKLANCSEKSTFWKTIFFSDYTCCYVLIKITTIKITKNCRLLCKSSLNFLLPWEYMNHFLAFFPIYYMALLITQCYWNEAGQEGWNSGQSFS